MERRIQLDCPPGNPRPGDLIAGVIEGLDLEEKDPTIKFFGCWTWDYSDVPDERWKEIAPVLDKRIGALYKKGIIRYGSW